MTTAGFPDDQPTLQRNVADREVWTFQPIDHRSHCDSVEVDTPGGKREFEIVKLFTIHDEAAG